MFIKSNKFIKKLHYYLNFYYNLYCKNKIEEAVAKYFIVTSTSFLHADNKMFKHMYVILRSLYTPLTLQTIGNELLNSVHGEVLSVYKTNFTGKTIYGTRWVVKYS